MLKILLILLSINFFAFANIIVQKPIPFSEKRIGLTKEYIKIHYNLDVKDIKIIPKIILIHHTAIDDFEDSYSRFVSEVLPDDRPDIASNKESVNVSAHFMVQRDGAINQLMPIDFMGRHVIGLNYSSVGIENVGGEKGVDNLTDKQLKANIFLINHLKKHFNTIEYVVAHYEYRCFENDKLWLEIDDNYRTKKDDPSNRFFNKIINNINGFKRAPCAKVSDDK